MSSDSALLGVYDELDVVWSISSELKLELLSTWMRYDVAPLTVPQSKKGVLSSVVLPLDGEDRPGAPGVESTVKLRLEDHEPFPQELDIYPKSCTSR